MSKQSNLNRVLDGGIVAILRSPNGDMLGDVAEALLAGGVEVLEITFTVPRAHKVLERVADRLGEAPWTRDCFGYGDRPDRPVGRGRIHRGPNRQPGGHPTLSPLRQTGHARGPHPHRGARGLGSGGGYRQGVPLGLTGPGYLKALLGPLPQVRLMPTGGVNLQTAADFLRAGACALGIGGALADPKSIAAKDFGKIESLARQYVKIVRGVRG